MTEPTDAGPGHDALFKALKDLIVEAQAVADDHHRPRYMRLDQALVSARNAMLDYWAATPQPTQAQAGAVPLTKEQAASLCKMGPVYAPDGQVVRTPEQYRRELEGAKLAGIRTAERAHGIKQGGQRD